MAARESSGRCLCTVRTPPAKDLQHDRVTAVAPRPCPLWGLMSHPSLAPPGWCELQRGTLLGGGGGAATGHWGSVCAGQAAAVQQTGSGLGRDLLGKYGLAGEGAWHGVMPPAATACQGPGSLEQPGRQQASPGQGAELAAGCSKVAARVPGSGPSHSALPGRHTYLPWSYSCSSTL